MMKYDVIVIGGSAAGIPAGVTVRRHYPEKSVLLVRKEKQVQIPCGIPYIYGTVMSSQKNLIPDAVLSKNKIDLLIDEAIDIDRDKKEVYTKSGKTLFYDRLIIATGSEPSSIPIPGLDKENVFMVKKEVPHLDKMLEVIDGIKDLVIIGGGFIGVEFADECNKNRDINISIIEMLPHCLILGYDEFFCEKAEEILEEKGIKIYRKNRVNAVTGNDKVSGVKLANGTELKADAVIVAVGARPSVEIARKAGLEIGPTKAIKVDRFMRTNDPNIFTCGDCAESTSFFTGEPIPLMLASVATMEARVAGANLFGLKRENPGEIGVFATKVGDVALGSAGLTERKATDIGYPVVTGEATTINRHPGGMPGMTKIFLKLVFNGKTGIILGAQVQGESSVGEIINALSACIQHRMTADDIAIFQCGTHPALTASPVAYQLTNAAESAIQKMIKEKTRDRVPV